MLSLTSYGTRQKRRSAADALHAPPPRASVLRILSKDYRWRPMSDVVSFHPVGNGDLPSRLGKRREEAPARLVLDPDIAVRSALPTAQMRLLGHSAIRSPQLVEARGFTGPLADRVVAEEVRTLAQQMQWPISGPADVDWMASISAIGPDAKAVFHHNCVTHPTSIHVRVDSASPQSDSAIDKRKALLRKLDATVHT